VARTRRPVPAACASHEFGLLGVDVVEHDFGAGDLVSQGQVGEHAWKVKAATAQTGDFDVHGSVLPMGFS
jgi:hypothetical protein